VAREVKDEGTRAVEQDGYQVRFDWGVDGAVAVGAHADVLVWVDVLSLDAAASADVALSLPGTGAIVAGDFVCALAVAQWIVDEQKRTGKRIAIAVIAAGAVRTAGYRFAVEDLLAAGAIIRCLGELGLDATSPEAAAAEAAYLGLDRGLAHLVSASVSAVEASASEANISGARELTRVDPTLGPADVRVIRLGV
jgi:hypothetical protein